MMAFGGVVGVSAISWYLALGSVSATYLAFVAGLILISAGALLRLSRRRLFVALLMILATGWPMVFGDLLWGRQ